MPFVQHARLNRGNLSEFLITNNIMPGSNLSLPGEGPSIEILPDSSGGGESKVRSSGGRRRKTKHRRRRRRRKKRTKKKSLRKKH